MRFQFNSILLMAVSLSCQGCPSGTVLTFTTSVEEAPPELRPGDAYQVNFRQNSDTAGVAMPEAITHHTAALVTEVRREERQLTLSLFLVTANPGLEAFHPGAGYQLDAELASILDAPVDNGGAPVEPGELGSAAVA